MNQELPRRVERAVNVVGLPLRSGGCAKEKETRIRRAHSAMLALSLSLSVSLSLPPSMPTPAAVVLEKVIGCAILMHRCKKKESRKLEIG